ncbi:4296_t:CDS:2, partial [Funneliformis geosporum]
VNEGQKNIISQQIIKVAENACIFSKIYEATSKEPDDPPQSTQLAGQTAFDIMMEQTRQPYFPTIKKEDTQKDVLYNDIIALLKKQ